MSSVKRDYPYLTLVVHVCFFVLSMFPIEYTLVHMCTIMWRADFRMFLFALLVSGRWLSRYPQEEEGDVEGVEGLPVEVRCSAALGLHIEHNGVMLYRTGERSSPLLPACFSLFPVLRGSFVPHVVFVIHAL